MQANPDKVSLEAVRRQILELERRLHEVKAELWSGTPKQEGAIASVVTEEKIRKLLKARRLRERQLGADLFADPAWDILLETFAAFLGQKRLSVSALCHASAVSSTTALRWVDKLLRTGWLQRRPDPFDGRRHWVELTPYAQAKLKDFFQTGLPTILPLCAGD
jgi:hypothetical protein